MSCILFFFFQLLGGNKSFCFLLFMQLRLSISLFLLFFPVILPSELCLDNHCVFNAFIVFLCVFLFFKLCICIWFFIYYWFVGLSYISFFLKNRMLRILFLYINSSLFVKKNFTHSPTPISFGHHQLVLYVYGSVFVLFCLLICFVF